MSGTESSAGRGWGGARESWPRSGSKGHGLCIAGLSATPTPVLRQALPPARTLVLCNVECCCPMRCEMRGAGCMQCVI
eukprot:1965669-Rhodomonas_salina.1